MESIYQNIHQDLIDRCKENDKSAQFSIYKLYYKAMFNSAYRILKNETDAEDIMQESFLKAFKKIDTYRGEVTFGVWLKRIVVNRSLDELRKKKEHFSELNDGVTSDLTDDSTSNEPFNYSIDEVKWAINQLADGYRVVLNLFLIEGYDHEEIASILNISNSTSRSQYLRAKRKLRELLLNKKAKTIALN
ncbi:sigma-70 family RNA polymerase sigma factor [Prolixibacteraceae bacterium JC049]|nr:sigma-70 family RNA polymerase sigma factor [Prolixibacteraceae bacterium JC049]